MNTHKSDRGGKQSPIYILVFSGLLLLFLSGFLKPDNSLSAEAQHMEPAVNAAIAEFEPALAVRASGCITCHAKVYSRYITDFGYGSPYFFGNLAGGSEVGFFNGHIYGDFIAEAGKTGWLTAEIHNEVIVPEADLDSSLKDAATTELASQSPYDRALLATSLAQYLRSLENEKANPSKIIEKRNLFIGAPDTPTLEARFGITPEGPADFKYIKNNPNASPDIKGIELSKNGGYYTNTSEIVCDGDLFVRGILFLNKAFIATDSGCRMYATGPIFLQDAVTYRSIGYDGDRTNLQLVSAEAIFLGVGQKKCNTTVDSDPLSSRLLLTPALTSIITRSADRNRISPKAFGQSLYNKAASVPLEDSSCHDETIGFSRILLNAPIVHSRYNGLFKGVVIAEFALFWQGKSSYEFDSVFKKVPVLPLLEDSDYLLVE